MCSPRTQTPKKVKQSKQYGRLFQDTQLASFAEALLIQVVTFYFILSSQILRLHFIISSSKYSINILEPWQLLIDTTRLTELVPPQTRRNRVSVACSVRNVVLLVTSDDVRDKMRSRYLSNPDYNFEKVNRASMACGPMVKWAIAQVNITPT